MLPSTPLLRRKQYTSEYSCVLPKKSTELTVKVPTVTGSIVNVAMATGVAGITAAVTVIGAIGRSPGGVAASISSASVDLPDGLTVVSIMGGIEPGVPSDLMSDCTVDRVTSAGATTPPSTYCDRRYMVTDNMFDHMSTTGTVVVVAVATILPAILHVCVCVELAGHEAKNGTVICVDCPITTSAGTVTIGPMC